MKKNELIGYLKQIKNNTRSVKFYILGQPDKKNDEIEFELYKARMHESLPQNIINLFYMNIKKDFIDYDYELLDYDPALTPDRKIIWKYSSSKVPFYNTIENKFKSIDSIKSYDSKKLPYGDIWAYWIEIQSNNNTYYLIKKVTPSKVIKTGSKLALIFRSDIFNRLEDDLLTMDGSFDAIYCNNQLFFKNKYNFEKAFWYNKEKKKVAENTLDEIGETELVKDISDVKNLLINDYYSISKLNKIKEKPYFKKLSFEECERIIANYHVDIETDSNKKKLNIKTKSQAKRFIKVLNDDYLMSEMTKNKYAANSKEDV